MNSDKPTIIAIDHDDYHAEHIGCKKDGTQFFLTTPFVPGTEGCEYIALFLFDSDGNLIDSKVDILGPRGSYDLDEKNQKYLARLESLGKVDYQRIEVKPFSIEVDGVEMGLIAVEPQDDDDIWTVDLEPGNFMSFCEPWDDGDYDT